jgi:hypothetical protein
MKYDDEDDFAKHDYDNLVDDIYEPTEEEIDEYYRQKAEKYWENKW